MRDRKRMWAIVSLSTLSTLSSCSYFSTFDSAKMLERNEFEISGIASKQSFLGYEEENEDLSIYQFGTQFRYGFSHRFTLGGQMVLQPMIDTYSAGSDTYLSIYAGIEPKIALGTKNHFAFSSPVGFFYEADDKIMMPQITPSFLFTAYPEDVVSTTLTLKGVWNAGMIEYFPPPFPAGTVGITISPRSVPIRITPEFGLIWYFDSFFASFGTSVSFIKRHTMKK